ncbi:hypothetical protein CYMTET_55231 [Cymbomonas tetramitiformis]|uniref:Uncharacterized protein n=1 Tax=Cymbomonas tetramitiformis TaxID=36881 RepID=A0AAE0ENC1_9CHLO|nr:hypothetical protein CYMTET_55231 [Cymbomonas tetramitiformis]
MTHALCDAAATLNSLKKILAAPALRSNIVEELICYRLHDTELCLLSMTCRGFALAVRNFYQRARDDNAFESRDRAIDRHYCTRSLSLMLWYLSAVQDLMNDARSDSLSRQACCFATSSRWTATIFDIQALMARPVNEALIRQGHFEHFKREFDKQSNTDHWYLGKVAVSVDATECVEFLITRDLGFLRSRELFQYAAEQGSVQCLDCLYKQLWNDPCSKMSVSNMKRLLEMALFFAIKSDRCDATGFILKKLM